MASTAMRSKAKIERIQQKFRNTVENGKFYEASQMSKTLYFRYKATKQYDLAENIIYESVLVLLQHEQHESAFDLAKLLVSLYKETKENQISDEPIEKITKIITLSSKDAEITRKDFIQQSLDWTTTAYKHGHPEIHRAAALRYWQDKCYDRARDHVIYTTDGTLCASFLIEYHVVTGFTGEIDLFVTQAVLQFLCLQNVITATATFFGYTSKHPGIRRKAKPYKQPLLNFIAFLLIIVEKGNLEQYTILVEKYQPSINRDPTYRMYLDKIGQLFFGLPPPQRNERSGMQGMLDDLMGSLFNPEQKPDVAMEAVTEDVD